MRSRLAVFDHEARERVARRVALRHRFHCAQVGAQGSRRELDAEIAKRGADAAVLAFSRPDERVEYWIRMPREPQAYAQKLYAALRELDGAGCGAILVESPPETDAWNAIRDRLLRATG